MRIAIPVTGERLEQYFGHCEKFILTDVDPVSRRVTATTEVPAPEHQPGLLPPWLKERGVTHVIAGNMGARARTLLQEAAVEVFAGAPVEPASVLVSQYLEGTLAAGENTCHH